MEQIQLLHDAGEELFLRASNTWLALPDAGKVAIEDMSKNDRYLYEASMNWVRVRDDVAGTLLSLGML
jgi:hypothetical protein